MLSRASSSVFAAFAVVGLVVLLAGCSRAPAETSPPPPPAVSVSYPVESEVTDYADFTGRVAAVDSVEVRAHVWGYLEKVNFKEGDLVKKGDVLFELDARPYEALLNQVKAKVRQDDAQLKFDEAEYQRDLKLAPTSAVSKSELDKANAARDVDLANLAADNAAVTSAELNLQYTKVVAPISGRASRYNVTVGNLIQSGDQAGGTMLTTIVSVDPIYVYFDVDEHTILRVGELVREGKSDPPGQGGYPVLLGLGNENGFPHQGTINFVDNQVNPKTGTIRLRGVFPNKDGALSAGLFARIRWPIGRPHTALLINERAVDSDQGQKIVYVVNDKNAVVVRPIQLGKLHDGLREVTEGIKPHERVIVNGLPQVRPDAVVQPKIVKMPASEGRKPTGTARLANGESSTHTSN